ncbi:substrate-binding domain-containing protein [Hippea alviniae]|uniref:substrate-binding domain-containing protein n=1 Tax=Hippea alviniae TaxID=1279027 RepID=UPI0003B358A0|nr:substrate-binding domain-containing protein [Hippea alviniae]
MRKLFFGVFVFLFVFSFEGFSCTLYWFTGAGIKKPAERIAKMFEKTHHCKVAIITGGSGQVLNEMLQTKKGAIYTLVDALFLKKAIKHKIVLKYDKILKLTPIFLISKSAESKIRTINDLAKAGVRIAGGDTRAMCLGETFREIMNKLPKELREKIEKNIVVRCLNVFQIVGYVKSGVVDAGIVLDKALVRDTNLKWIDIPEKCNVHRYGYVALIRYSNSEKAKELYNFILKHLNVYREYGFELIKPR